MDQVIDNNEAWNGRLKLFSVLRDLGLFVVQQHEGGRCGAPALASRRTPGCSWGRRFATGGSGPCPGELASAAGLPDHGALGAALPDVLAAHPALLARLPLVPAPIMPPALSPPLSCPPGHRARHQERLRHRGGDQEELRGAQAVSELNSMYNELSGRRLKRPIDSQKLVAKVEKVGDREIRINVFEELTEAMTMWDLLNMRTVLDMAVKAHKRSVQLWRHLLETASEEEE